MTRSAEHLLTRHPLGGTALAGVAAATGALCARYVRVRDRLTVETLRSVEHHLHDIGAVDTLTVLPLVERLTVDERLRGEPGVSYLLNAGGTSILFDCGLGQGRGSTVLEANAAALAVDAADAAAVVISHLHPDHIGGIGAMRRRTFAIPAQLRLPSGVPAFVPTQMSHSSADVVVVDRPRVVAPGVAVLSPLSRMMFWLGPVAEQALVVNVRDFGLVLITGCGHPRIDSTLAAAERALDLPVRAVVGGLHLPVHPVGTPLVPQAVLGNPYWPWHPIGESDARAAIAAISEITPKLVALSGHDSTPWTYGAFADAFGDRYRTLRAGEPLSIKGRDARV